MSSISADEFEKLGVFYLGRRYDLTKSALTDELLLYQSSDLLTHAVCIGMTGSGKTGLCLNLVEESAIDGIPVIAIDPKGDLSNLLLTFPHLSPEEFLPWVSADEARQKQLTVEQLAEQQSKRWAEGLASWGESAERVQRLRQSADFKIYTPGSTAGLPISIVQSLSAPSADIREDEDAFRELISTTASCLLALLGSSPDPLKSREHILVSKILEKSWSAEKDLSLPEIIQQIQKPPMSQVGAIDLESFFPSKERFELAMTVNNLLAAPGFDAWLSGQPLDIGKLLYADNGKPQVSIFSIAHLSDSERMFFVTLLLSQMIAWMRSQPGTSSLRAILYMDEIFGYFPPIANPPSKRPLLTLLKQARAYGLGVLLASQNPVDLDYKGLANTGTWFIGRLQTERDKMRVLEGLEGAAAEVGSEFNRQQMEKILAGLGQRVFLMNNVHEKRPEIFQSRWTMSYLRGPLTKTQIKSLMDPIKKSANLPRTSSSAAVDVPTVDKVSASMVSTRPALPPTIQQYFLQPSLPLQADQKLSYKPMLFARSSVHFADPKNEIDSIVERSMILSVDQNSSEVNWSNAQTLKISSSHMLSEPQDNALFEPVPSLLANPASYKIWQKSLLMWLSQTQKMYLLRCAELKLLSKQNETESAFRSRIALRANELRDDATRELQQKYSPKVQSLEEKIQAAHHRLEREQEESKEQQLQSAISVGATILGAMVGRKPINSRTIGSATSAARGVGRVSRKMQDAARAEESLQSLQVRLNELEEQFRSELTDLKLQFGSQQSAVDTVTILPKKTQIQVTSLCLLWAPYAQSRDGQLKALFL